MMKKYFQINNSISDKTLIETLYPNDFCLIDKNNGDFVIGWEIEDVLEQNLFQIDEFDEFTKNSDSYLFGYFGYDIKNSILPKSESNNNDIHNFPELVFYKTKHVVIKQNNQCIYYGTKKDYKAFQQLILKPKQYSVLHQNNLHLESSISKQDYIKNVNKLKEHIQFGNIYEVNYCIQFKKINKSIHSIQTYFNLKQNTKAPFSSFFKYKHIEILSASPERFYKKQQNTIISQPIKGTAARGKTSLEDEKIKTQLKTNSKEISENVMIVDLVRNDLSKLPNVIDVKTPELCKLYTFDTVHQLISTVKAQTKNNLTSKKIIKNLFPMGSMTGAPKIRACQTIDVIENFKRGIYSGSIGFITPENNHDFNVIIRTILYNSNNKTVSVSVGGAITIKSKPEEEYNECLLKLKAINKSIVEESNI
jgi:para-aminobenzoate synthetase component 1